ncbi:GNAT family N-acetyltransferase [Pinisolibacter aquiterrae]|uniref:GNAT family N-acetyltransferase n=1 Tax=Pinisolibacter aquiterrae TaxID=2815579 RepID=UPI001C3C3EE1|nr:GNAT family N-acetyltransferase [Pinisolibacter aquiterrae]MBV5266330.1 GNAT family N-acetyltransferase [Pinisolibacter aquiterrae]MCC8236477.1 GNAT family N-acetyltransferase [Pinisolibacter aquiterrae]
MSDIRIEALADTPAVRAALTDLLIETVAAGGSVSFMHPLERERADAFWAGSLAAAGRGERIVFGAFDGDGDVPVATLTLLLECPPNQPHRAELAKMMTRPSHRGRGLAMALVRTAEREAVARGKTLMVLDTARDEGAAGLYEKAGFVYAGEIPDYALKPHGGLTGTLIYWKRIGAAA